MRLLVALGAEHIIADIVASAHGLSDKSQCLVHASEINDAIMRDREFNVSALGSRFDVLLHLWIQWLGREERLIVAPESSVPGDDQFSNSAVRILFRPQS